MTFTVYALSAPSTPNIIAYVGRTAQHPNKRASDHVSQAKFRARVDKRLAPVHKWLLQLLDKGERPVLTILGQYDSDTAAEQAERFLTQSLPCLHNRGNTVSGRPVGSIDSPEARAKKRAAWASKPREVKTELRTNQAKTRRINDGYPHPDLPTKHPLNEAHNRMLRGKGPRKFEFSAARSAAQREARMKEFYEWRVAAGFPNPTEGCNHPDNYEWTLANHDKYPKFRDWVKVQRSS